MGGLSCCFGPIVRQQGMEETCSGSKVGVRHREQAEGWYGSDLKPFPKPHLLLALSPPSSTNLRVILLNMSGQSSSKL